MLTHIICDPDFDEEVEIVVSDNCSADSTKEEVEKIAFQYPNVRYYCNSENVSDKNFYLALSRGRGSYLKLLNDYVYFKPGGLKIMKNYIRKYEGQDANLFFYSRIRRPNHRFGELQIENVDSFVYAINNKITWIANFGVWKAHFEELNNSDMLWKTQLAQMDWTLHEVSLRRSVVVNFHGYSTLTVPNKKMTYVFFIPHIINYYGVYKAYVDRGLISPKTIDYDKYRILSHFVGSRIIEYIYLERETAFDRKKAKDVLDKYFRNISYYHYLKLKGEVLKVLQRSGILGMVKSIRKFLLRR